VNISLPRPYIPEYFVEMLLEMALLEAKTFDVYVYCSVDFPMEKDDVRPDDEEYRKQVGYQILNFLETYKLNYFVVKGDVSARLRTLNQALYGS
jgi:nicotinamide riboside kinase